MAASKEIRTSAETAKTSMVAELLGGRQVFGSKIPQNHLEAHEVLAHGLPAKALTFLVRNLVLLAWDSAFERALGISQRTYQRHMGATSKLLGLEQTSRTWKFAEILAKATAIFGSKEEAEQWLERPATGLNQRRPLDLLATSAGVELVEDFLMRLEYGTYT